MPPRAGLACPKVDLADMYLPALTLLAQTRTGPTLFEMFLDSTLEAKIIFGILVLMSIVSWAIMISKAAR